MKAIYINPFLISASHVFEQFELSCQLGNPSIKNSPFEGNEVLSVVGITGQIRGQMYLGGSMSSTLRVVSAMMGEDKSKMDTIEQSVICELANMICGNAISIFSKEGVSSDINPPYLVLGKQIEVSDFKLNLLSVPIILNQHTEIEMGIAFDN